MKAQCRSEIAKNIAAGTQPPLNENWDVLSQVFSLHSERFYRIAYRVLGSREDAEDAVQDGLLSAARKLDSFEGRSRLSTWLTRIVINESLMRLRNNRKSRLVSIDQECPYWGGSPLIYQIPDERLRPDESFAHQEQFEILNARIAELPGGLRRAVRLYYIEGASVAETAEELGISEAAVKARLFRARLKVLKKPRNCVRTGRCPDRTQTASGHVLGRTTQFRNLQVQPSTL